MGLNGQDPPLVELIYGPILIILMLPTLPITWVFIILHDAKRVVLGQVSFKKACKQTGEMLAASVAMPLWGLFYYLLILSMKIATPIFHIIYYLSKKGPHLSILKPRQRARNEKVGYGGPLGQKPYRYQPLDEEHEVRLLTIYPGSFKDPLWGDIVTVNLLWRPTYDALSYTWADEAGDTERSRTIQFVKDGSTISITKNCEAAIRRLRFRNQKRRIWIDAICINQNSNTERNQQVALMSRIYVTAHHVIVYSGEGTSQTNSLFDWVNDVAEEDLNIPSIGKFEDIDVAGLGILTGAVRVWNGLGATKTQMNWIASKLERIWSTIKARFFSLFRKSKPSRKIALSDSQLTELASDYFLRRWFKRVWVLQEVALPGLHKTIVLCGGKSTTGERALHLLSILKNQKFGSMIRILILIRQRIEEPKRSHLLDILIETRDRECEDPRDKIFGVLSIARGMDKGRFPELKANYVQDASVVYAQYSAVFIRHHGPGFFLALIKSRPRLAGLPSWAADWSVPWPNYKAVEGRDFAAVSRSAEVMDTEAQFSQEKRFTILKLHRPRILRGYFTRDGHMDGSNDTHVEDVKHLVDSEVLIEMYPGLAALLIREGDYHVFIRVCPHALSENGVEKLVETWSNVVVDGDNPEEQIRHFADGVEYKSPAETFKIR